MLANFSGLKLSLIKALQCVWGDGGHVTGEVIGPLNPKAPDSNLILKNSRVVIKKELKLRQ